MARPMGKELTAAGEERENFLLSLSVDSLSEVGTGIDLSAAG